MSLIDCMIIGDSLAVGVAKFRPECAAYAQVGINSHDFTNRYLLNTKGTEAKSVIISLGSNDMAKLDTLEELESLRQMITADRVYWILPNIKETKRKAVWLIATKYKDIIIDARNYDRSPDNVHPTMRGYKDIAQETKK